MVVFMKKSKNGYYVNRHSCFLLQYHLVLVTKYRHPVLMGELKEALIAYTQAYFTKQGFPIIELNIGKDHIHILFESHPQVNLANFVNGFKSASSRKMRAQFATVLAPYYWKPYFWSLSYFICTVSDRSVEAVKRYIQNQ